MESRKPRVQITFGDVLLQQIDEYCERTGMSRSAFVCSCVAEKLDAQNRLLEIAGLQLEKAIEVVKDNDLK